MDLFIKEYINFLEEMVLNHTYYKNNKQILEDFISEFVNNELQ